MDDLLHLQNQHSNLSKQTFAETILINHDILIYNKEQKANKKYKGK